MHVACGPGGLKCRVQERLAELRSKDPENEQSRISAVRVQFSAKVDVKVFGVNSPASTHVGDMSGEIETEM